MRLITADGVPASPARVHEPTEPPVRVGLVQHAWDQDRERLRATLLDGIRTAAGAGARVVFLPELTLSRYPADTLPSGRPDATAESLQDGPTMAFARAAAADTGVHVHASLFERSPGPDGSDDGLGYNTAVLVAPDGALVGRTRKTHIPVTAGYHEDRYFRAGPPEDAYPVHDCRRRRRGCASACRPAGTSGSPRSRAPTASRRAGAGVPDRDRVRARPPGLRHPAAVGAHDRRRTPSPAALFVVAPNRYGTEGLITFYGSSFVADPYGRVLVRAPRDEAAALVADLDLAQRETGSTSSRSSPPGDRTPTPRSPRRCGPSTAGRAEPMAGSGLADAPEWAPHERTWMAWPSSGYTLGDTEDGRRHRPGTWAAVAVAVARFEPVTRRRDPGSRRRRPQLAG